jgi:hypothetical protein
MEETKPPTKHFFKAPANISEATDAEIDEFAAAVWEALAKEIDESNE